MESAFKAAQELYDDTLEIVQQRRANGSVGNDLIGYLLRANDDGRMLDDAKITELIRQFLPAAAETTTRSFGSMLVALLERPALLDRVRADRTQSNRAGRSEEHTSELQSLMRISYAVFCLKKKKQQANATQQDT